MQASLRKFIFNLVLLTLSLTAAGYGLFLFVIPKAYFPLFPLVPFVLFAVTLAVHLYLVKASANDPRKFTAHYLGSMGIKMVIYIVFLIIVLVLAREFAGPLLVSFLICYIAFTIMEVAAILKHQKRG
jgi:hypothetical protein